MNLQKGNAPLIVIIVVIVLGILGALLFNTSKSQDTTQTGLNRSGSEGNQAETGDGPIGVAEDGRYIEYTPEGYEIHKGQRRVLFFYANWCPTCQPVDEEIKNNQDKIPEDLTIIRVNYNDSDTDADEKQLANKYAVTYQHTFVVLDSEENAVQIWNGGDFNDLLNRI